MRLADNVFNAGGREGYKEYREHYSQRKVERKDIVVHRDRYCEAVSAIGEAISETVVDRLGGVFMKKLGYFFIWMIPRPLVNTMPSKNGSVKKYNHHTGNKMYTPIFMPVKNTWLSLWTMDKKFTKPMKKALSKKLISGKKYKTFFYDFKRYLS